MKKFSPKKSTSPLITEEDECDVVKKKFPQKFIARIREIIPKNEWDSFFTTCTEPLPKIIRITNSPFQEKFIKPNGWDLQPIAKIARTFFISRENQKKNPLGKTLEHFSGQIYSVSASSLLSAEILNPQIGDKVLDMCAAPGSKATFIAEKIGQKEGFLVANEMSSSRSKKLASNIDRLGLINVLINQNDGTYMNTFFEQEFDKILLDAPCSSEGFGRKSSQFFMKNWDESKIFECSKLQKKLIISAFQMLAPGGEMVYSTCTSAPEENELVVQFLLENFPDSTEVLEVRADKIPHKKGLSKFRDQKIDHQISQNVLRLYPHLRTKNWDSEIFFIAKIKKNRGISRPNITKSKSDYVKVLGKNQTAEVIVSLVKKFHLPRPVFEKLAVIEKDHEFYLTNKNLANFCKKNAHRRAGMKIIDKYGSPTNIFARTFGHLANKNIINLSQIQKDNFIAGKDLNFSEKLEFSNGEIVIVKYKKFGLGIGKIMKNGKLLKNKLERNLTFDKD